MKRLLTPALVALLLHLWRALDETRRLLIRARVDEMQARGALERERRAAAAARAALEREQAAHVANVRRLELRLGALDSALTTERGEHAATRARLAKAEALLRETVLARHHETMLDATVAKMGDYLAAPACVSVRLVFDQRAGRTLAEIQRETVEADRSAVRVLVESLTECDVCAIPATRTNWRTIWLCDAHDDHPNALSDVPYAPALRALLSRMKGWPPPPPWCPRIVDGVPCADDRGHAPPCTPLRMRARWQPRIQTEEPEATREEQIDDLVAAVARAPVVPLTDHERAMLAECDPNAPRISHAEMERRIATMRPIPPDEPVCGVTPAVFRAAVDEGRASARAFDERWRRDQAIPAPYAPDHEAAVGWLNAEVTRLHDELGAVERALGEAQEAGRAVVASVVDPVGGSAWWAAVNRLAALLPAPAAARPATVPLDAPAEDLAVVRQLVWQSPPVWGDSMAMALGRHATGASWRLVGEAMRERAVECVRRAAIADQAAHRDDAILHREDFCSTRWPAIVAAGGLHTPCTTCGAEAQSACEPAVVTAPARGRRESVVTDLTITSASHLRLVLDRISFGPALALEWEWKVRLAWAREDDARAPLADVFLLAATFRRPDRDSGEMGRGHGRWWWIDAGASESTIVKTAWLAVRQIVEHEAMESFFYGGARPFDPHRTVGELCAR